LINFSVRGAAARSRRTIRDGPDSMKQTLLQEKYPIFVAEIDKTETRCATVDDVVAYFKDRIAATPKVRFIEVFDHFAHTAAIGGMIAPEIRAAVDVIFCFGFALPDPLVLAVRPRSIGIADLGNRFVISFLEAPMAPANEAMEEWVKGLRDKA
jgi:hypothetical protein